MGLRPLLSTFGMAIKKTLQMIVDHDRKILVPLDMNLFHFCIGDFQSGEEVTVTIETKVRIRSLAQNGLFYKYVDAISKSTGNEPETIKHYAKMKSGIRHEVSGELKSTTSMSTVEMNHLIDTIYRIGIEAGIHLPLPEDLKNNNLKID